MKKASSKTTAPAMRDNSDFIGGVRGKFAGDSGLREAGGKELAKQNAEGQTAGAGDANSRRTERSGEPVADSPKGSAEALAT